MIEREAERMLENLKHQFEGQGLQFDTATFDAPEYKTGTMLQAEKNIRTRLVLEKIAEAEAITPRCGGRGTGFHVTSPRPSG